MEDVRTADQRLSRKEVLTPKTAPPQLDRPVDKETWDHLFSNSSSSALSMELTPEQESAATGSSFPSEEEAGSMRTSATRQQQQGQKQQHHRDKSLDALGPSSRRTRSISSLNSPTDGPVKNRARSQSRLTSMLTESNMNATVFLSFGDTPLVDPRCSLATSAATSPAGTGSLRESLQMASSGGQQVAAAAASSQQGVPPPMDIPPQILAIMQQQRMAKRGNKSSIPSVRVPVRAMTTARTLIMDTLTECINAGIPHPAIKDPDAYLVRIADDDGAIEEDFDALGMDRFVEQTGLDTFALCMNPAYEPPAEEESHSAGPAGTSGPQDLDVYDFGPPPTLGEGGCDGDRRRRRVLFGIGDLCIRLVLVAEESGKETPKRIFVPPDLLLKNFTDLVCSKLDLEKESCKQLTFFENGVESEILPAQLENTMQHAGKLEYKLLIAEDSLNRGGASSDFGGYFFSEFTVSQYVEYDVVKINKYGMRQHRKLGIDREKLYNSAPSKSGFSFRKKGSTKQPQRSIRDIVDLYIVQEKPQCFCTLFRTRRGKEKILLWEARSEAEACDIVARLQFLQALHTQSMVMAPVQASPARRPAQGKIANLIRR